MIVKTEAIVLKSMRYRETSKIVTFYTRRFGKLAGIAKGAREMKSKFGGSLEPMTAVSLVLYKKDQRDLQLISQCDIRNPYKRIHSEIERMSAAMSVLELLHHLTHNVEENPTLYALVTETLDAVEGVAGNIHNCLLSFQLRLCSVLGFAPLLDRCLRCGKALSFESNEQKVMFQLDKGGLLCAACTAEVGPAADIEVQRGDPRQGIPGRLQAPVYAPIRSSTGKIMQRLIGMGMDGVGSLEYPAVVGNELDATLRSYLRYHFEDLRPLKAPSIFEKIVN